ncbi:MAG: aminodeoxychorismate synthase, component I [Pseudomonadales bacterium]|nr:aminodeoxychorismate synthase, component I [Pseudomonadales bacterium]
MGLISKALPYGECSLDRFSRVRGLGKGLLLDSGTGYLDHIDVMAAAPANTLSLASGADPASSIEHIRRKLAQYTSPISNAPIAPGWFGVWSYNLGSALESVAMSSTNLPSMWMGFYPALIITDHAQHHSQLLYIDEFHNLAQQLERAYLGASPAHEHFTLTASFEGNLPGPEYRQQFEKTQQYIQQGDCYQINLSREFCAPYTGSAWQAYRQLRALQSAPMGGYIEADDWALLSLSPERFLRSVERRVETKPIKGTRPRSNNPREDLTQREDLMSSKKDRAENLMIVDLLRNDLGRSCKTGSVKVDKLFDIESFSNVHHLVSTISGQLAEDVDALDLLLRAFPGGSVTGAPKHRAMEIIEELEPHSRDFYCGSMLYLDVCGRMDSNILIRSLLASNGTIRCWGGGGIVADSTAAAEYQEINDKIGKLLKSLQ